MEQLKAFFKNKDQANFMRKADRKQNYTAKEMVNKMRKLPLVNLLRLKTRRGTAALRAQFEDSVK
jgi:hypothetical protein